MASTKCVSDCSAAGVRHQVPYPPAPSRVGSSSGRGGLPTGLGDWCL